MKRLRNFLQGIYGIDGFSCGLLLLSILLSLGTTVVPSAAVHRLNVISVLPLAYCLFRFFSHNHSRRNLENQKFMKIMSPVFEYVDQKNREKEETRMFRFFKCPSCTQKIRVPRGKGKIEITCPKCGNKFIKKT